MRKRKRINLRKIRSSRSYTVKELAGIISRDVETILRWIREGKLQTVSKRRPLLLDGQVVKDWLAKRHHQRRVRCAHGEFFCMRCKAAKPARRGSVSLSLGRKLARITAVCEECGTPMYRFASLLQAQRWARDKAAFVSPDNTLQKEISRPSNAVLGRTARKPQKLPSKGEQLEFLLSVPDGKSGPNEARFNASGTQPRRVR